MARKTIFTMAFALLATLIIVNGGRVLAQGWVSTGVTSTPQPAGLEVEMKDGVALLLWLGALLPGLMLLRSSGSHWSIVLSEPGLEMQTIKVGRDGVWVGRDPSCEVHLHDAAVDPQHCWIGSVQGRRGQLYIRDNHSTTGVIRNGKKIKSGGFSETDTVRIGDATLRVIRS